MYDPNYGSTATYTYNADGIRTKTQWVYDINEEETIEYILDGNNTLIGTDYTHTKFGEVLNSKSIRYFYDESGAPVFCICDGTTYYYVKNQQGDITGLMLADGTIVVTYEYDAWGNIIDHSFVRNHVDVYSMNVYTYRGYQYDKDTGFYYLQSRYYDPEVGRFLNADDTNYLGASGTVLSHNLYTYCENNVINRIDPSGQGLVGVGIQLELGYGALAVGMEFVWYFSSQVNVGNRNRLSPYCYVYGGISAGTGVEFKRMINSIIKNPGLLLSPKSILTGFNASICVFAIYGYSSFKSPNDYLYGFTGVYASAWHVKTYSSWSSKCITGGIGWSSYYISAGRSDTTYRFYNQFLDQIGKAINNLFYKVKEIGSTIVV